MDLSFYQPTIYSLAQKYSLAGVTESKLQHVLLLASKGPVKQSQLAQENHLLEALLLASQDIGYLAQRQTGIFPNETTEFIFNETREHQ